MSKFQLILTGVFGFLAVIGVIIFSAYKGSSGQAANVVMWGTVPAVTFNKIIAETALFQNKEISLSYVEKSQESFDADFIEALASGTGPDIIMLQSDKLLKHRNKIFAIPFDVFSARQFKDSFIEGAEIYMFPEGILGLPIFVDPLVMYWNRPMFAEAKVTTPPQYWDEFYELTKLMSKKDGSLNILKSTVALGEFSNIAHAKEIILNLAMQAGTPITTWEEGKIKSVFNESFGKPIIPAEAAVNFYTEFGNPAKTSYSWNRSLPNSTNYFLNGDLALYFGLASEIADLQLKNPNLNFDVAAVPTSREGGSNVSFANFNAVALTKSSKNLSAAFSAISILSGVEGAAAFNKFLKLPPARRDLLAKRPADAFESVFRDSAIRSKTWLDPLPTETNGAIKGMIESITSGRARTAEAVAKVHKEFASLLPE